MDRKNEIYIINTEIERNKKNFIEKIAKHIKKRKNIGFAGYSSKKGLEKNLSWQIFNQGPIDKNFAFDQKKIRKVIEETLKKCQNIINKKIYVFVFPSYNKFTNEKMGGVGGNSPLHQTILIFINTFTKKWEKNLKETICHEFTHAVSPFYNSWENNIGEGVVLDGIAENFQEKILKNGESMFSNLLTEKECKKIFLEISAKFKSKKRKEYNEIFYGEGKYKNWTGYAIGYWSIKKYLKNSEKINWKKIINTNPKKILIKIKKIL